MKLILNQVDLQKPVECPICKSNNWDINRPFISIVDATCYKCGHKLLFDENKFINFVVM